MLIPSLLTLFRRMGITTIVIAAEEEQGQSPQNGLLPMSDLVLRFDTYKLDATHYHKIVKTFSQRKSLSQQISSSDMSGWKDTEIPADVQGEMRCFIIEAMRVHWGQVGARRALIERARADKKDRMRVIPLPAEFPLGERIWQ